MEGIEPEFRKREKKESGKCGDDKHKLQAKATGNQVVIAKTPEIRKESYLKQMGRGTDMPKSTIMFLIQSRKKEREMTNNVEGNSQREEDSKNRENIESDILRGGLPFIGDRPPGRDSNAPLDFKDASAEEQSERLFALPWQNSW